MGTVAFFHGCARMSASFFPYSAACLECVGLPAELALTKQALARGYAVLALTAKNQRSQCWSSGGFYKRNDQMQAMHVLADFLTEQGLDKKPLYLAGASSGATFAVKLPSYLLRFATADRCVPAHERPATAKRGLKAACKGAWRVGGRLRHVAAAGSPRLLPAHLPISSTPLQTRT